MVKVESAVRSARGTLITAVVITSCISTTAQAGLAADRVFQATAEPGTVTSAWSGAEGVVITGAAAKTGRLGYEVAASNAPGYVQWDDVIEQQRTHFSVRLWVQVKSVRPGESVDILTVRNSFGVRDFDFFLGAGGRFRWDIAGSQPGPRSETRVALNRWYLVEAFGDFADSQHEVTVRINGQDQGTLINRRATASTVHALRLGTVAPKTHRQWYDDVAVRVGDSSIGFLEKLPPPPEIEQSAPAAAAPSSSAPSRDTSQGATPPEAGPVAGPPPGDVDASPDSRGTATAAGFVLALCAAGLIALGVGPALARRRR